MFAWVEKPKKKHRVCKKGCFWNPATCSHKNVKFEGSIGDLIIKYDEITEQTKAIPTKSTAVNNNKQ